MTINNDLYTGRFAPSPTGPLHIGSLIGALASYLDARANRGQWLLRIEDIDPPREVAGAAQAIIDCLIRHQLHWDGEVLWQSQRQQAYQQARDKLLDAGQAFYCRCSRATLQASQGIHPDSCGRHPPTTEHAIRVNFSESNTRFTDAIQGHYSLPPQGDLVIQRRDKLFAYQLAVVVDDAYQGINHIVRGSDLLASTPGQIFLQQQLGLATPAYAHFPVINNPQGQKLSKQTHAPALDPDDVAGNLLYALDFLNQPLPSQAQATHAEGILEHAIENWQLSAIPRCLAMVELAAGGFACSPVTQ